MNIRVDAGLVAQLDDLARRQDSDRGDVARRILGEGLRRERLRLALDDYRAGRVSVSRAATDAGVTIYEMLGEVSSAGVPYEIDPSVLARLATMPKRGPSGAKPPRAGGGSAIGTPDVVDVTSGVADLRATYRPARVRILFVGESSPAGGTHFYRGNSNLFRAVRDAFDVDTGAEPEAFLRLFADEGCWLVDLADRPVNRVRGRPRRDFVDAGIERLRATIDETRPQRIVAIRTSVAGAVRQAARLANFDDASIDVLPFPLYQWRRPFVDQLRAILLAEGVEPVAARQSGTRVAEGEAAYDEAPGLHDAMATVLADRGRRWTPSRFIADEIARRNLWRRPSDGRHPEASQISARARRYPKTFQVSDDGIRLR